MLFKNVNSVFIQFLTVSMNAIKAKPKCNIVLREGNIDFYISDHSP